MNPEVRGIPAAAATRVYRWSAAPALVAVAAGLCLAGCSNGTPRGTALSASWMAGGTSGISPLRPGLQLGVLDVLLHNSSRLPVTIDSIEIRGRGVGTVIRVLQVRIAPFQAAAKAVPGSAYNTDPPVQWIAGSCHEQILRPVRGYRLLPGQNAYIWEIIDAIGPGRYHVPDHVVTYSQGGTQYQAAIDTGYQGTVADHARYIAAQASQTRCLKATGARLLTWFTRQHPGDGQR
jgi:hypothetical protein